VKTRILLNHLDRPAGYVPIDISREHLLRSATSLARSYPQVSVVPVCADYTQVAEVPDPDAGAARRVLFFPGSTIGNLDPAAAEALLVRMARIVGPGGGLLIGVDLDKDPQRLELAYDDPQGVTAAFELNVLRRINRELGGNFDLRRWEYRARYDVPTRCVEMSVVSLCAQGVQIGEAQFSFAAGEQIITERSHKYTIEGFRALARRARLEASAFWTDPEELFSVQFFAVP
jgi:dimethylhistidine N-methyltransferase